ncbi:hypothetical protein BC826DRAFT_1056076, partial [Russula brevipes]
MKRRWRSQYTVAGGSVAVARASASTAPTKRTDSPRRSRLPASCRPLPPRSRQRGLSPSPASLAVADARPPCAPPHHPLALSSKDAPM